MMLCKDINNNILNSFLKRESHNINNEMMVNKKCKDLIQTIEYKTGND